VEALVRWRHPERGIVAPGQFINVAEEAGLIGALGLFVLETACRQFMRWRLDLGPQAPSMLAVNLSVAQLCQADLVGQVRQALVGCAMPPACLQLEVTESLAAQDPASLGRLRALKALGVGLALDDFGTGYSSLSCLHQLPVDTVKIDRSFVIEAERSEYHRALIEATVRVARTLRMSTVAEGIETDAQSALVQSLGCDLGQGYLYCRPMEAEALTLWLAEREPARRAAPYPLLLVSGG
jgi:EAL domain-containing protein (putative c-di-GMP-specific phosphodiesterase class I)